MRQSATSKSQVVSAIRAAKRRLKRTPTRAEFERLSGIHWMKVQRLFGGYRVAVREAGLEPDPGGVRIDTAAMLVDFARVAREVGRHPTRDEYCELGRYSSASLETRFQRWSAIRMQFLEFVEASGLEREWKDVVEKLKSGPVPRRGGGKAWLKGDRRRMAKAKNNLPQMNTDERRLKSGKEEDRRHRATSPTPCPSKPTAGFLGTPTSHVIGESQPEAEPNPVDVTGREQQTNAEVLMPELRGMRCVTRTMLWALCANATPLKHGGTEETEEDGCDRRNRRDGGSSGNRNVDGLAHHRVTETRRIETESAAGSAGISAYENNLRLCNHYFPKRVLPGRPLLGAPLMRNGLMYEPVNEMGVVFLFGMMAHRLGFWVESLQAGFPDCEAKLEVEPGRWQHVRIEFEFESRKFRDHRHDATKCDMIVCWRHNWKGCPREIQVLELCGLIQSPRSRVIAAGSPVIGKTSQAWPAGRRELAVSD